MPSPAKNPPPSSLTTPFDSNGEVDLLLQEIGTPAAPTPARSKHQAAHGARRGGDGRRALVVDATPIARKFLLQRLRGLGYDVQAVESGERALELIRQQSFAVVFIELSFGPESSVDGLALCQAVKHHGAHVNAVPPAIVITTGQAGSAHRVRGSLAGCDAFLNKPLIEAEFMTTLRAVDPLFQ